MASIALGRADSRGRDTSRRDMSAPWRHIDWVLLVAVVAAACFGSLMIYSATKGPQASDTYFLYRQLLFVAFGSVVMAGIALVDYRRLRDFAPLIYGAAVFLLLAVLSPLGDESKGAQAWFRVGPFQLQPSEFAKIAVIVALAALLESFHNEVTLVRLARALALVGVPGLLILVQNDLGTALVFLAITMGMFTVGGVRGRHLAALVLLGIVLAAGVLTSDLLAEYQTARLTVFTGDASGEEAQTIAYNVEQAQVAIATGGVTGQGLFDGPQTQLAFVPEQQTDFIFTVPAEELGFLGAAAVLGLYAVIMWRIWRTAQLARDPFGTLLAVGVLSMLMFQLFQNAGMAMNIMPVTGLPFPFLSYGGSSTIASFIAVGIVLSVHMHRFR